ncbi:ubiquitin carboxyl-terminal hydrolase 45 [Bombina bombina]|uniref:ubiquitin carboxyl-terminal hydrolase 45 n=1 Tax=Bombina bombina TaxID=8345 RepID=UPI00235B14A2|nr:ubiquitin carboxyl-terminal hydrolase 45 [Bombina bombina]XP_053566544.1 ubiquitin carboxyl-terminal hydrolase 45 [Bombina bombina]
MPAVQPILAYIKRDMRVKQSTLWGTSEKNKRSKRANRPQDEDSSDDLAGLTCHHVCKAVDVNNVKRAVAQAVWSVCNECMKERRTRDGELVAPSDVWLCLKCGHQGCGVNSEGQHSKNHFKSLYPEPHSIVINLSTWVIWCYECDEELSTQCNKKALAQIADFLQKHSSRSTKGSSSKVVLLREECSEVGEIHAGKSFVSSSVPVKGINNLGNTCFFNAVMQNLAQTHMLNEALNEIKEKGTKLKIVPNAESELDPLVISLSTPGPLTSAVFLFLHSMKEGEKEPLSPKVLFNQLCQKAPRFKTFQQQDSQELLHYLLDAMQLEETKRIQAGILKAFNNPTSKTADEETKRKVKAYGREGVKMNFVDRVFVGELTSTVMCEECGNISTVKEAFIDLSLPIIEERVSKPVAIGRGNKDKDVTEKETPHWNCNNNQPMKRRQQLTKNNNQLTQEQMLSVEDDNRNPVIMQDNSVNADINIKTESPLLEEFNATPGNVSIGSQSEGSEKGDCSQSESSGDADSEASEYETLSLHIDSKRGSSASGESTSSNQRMPMNSNEVTQNSVDSDYGALSGTFSNLSLNSMDNSLTEKEPTSFTKNLPCLLENIVLPRTPLNAFQTLSQGYVTSSKECSIQSCLYQFTTVELLMGNNKLLCEICTENRLKYQRKTTSYGDKQESVYTNARKQLLISAAPANLILHLKRFYQNGLTLRKINRHVDFPFILDLAPFCSASCKNVKEDKSVLYSLYGIVEHSGSMRGGHYAAYVKIRMPFKRKNENVACLKSPIGIKERAGATSSQWVYVSDTHVQMVSESRVFNSQAYLLFYERLL